jgi:hypothetical protein
MSIIKSITFGTMLFLGLAAWAQEFPRVEVGADYSYVRYAPSASYSKGHSLNGGGGSATFNITSYLGIKMDLQGFNSNTTGFNIAPNSTFPNGLNGNVSGNLFTYLFGPQVKIRLHGFQPFGQLLFGGAHSNVYGNAFKTLCQPVAGACAISGSPDGNTGAMEFGGGLDIPITKTISFKPAEIDYLLTRFSNPLSGKNNQSNFRYSAGIVFTFGYTAH